MEVLREVVREEWQEEGGEMREGEEGQEEGGEMREGDKEAEDGTLSPVPFRGHLQIFTLTVHPHHSPSMRPLALTFIFPAIHSQLTSYLPSSMKMFLVTSWTRPTGKSSQSL